jgi:RNA polymerase sigma-70 factor (ECF subfamily)
MNLVSGATPANREPAWLLQALGRYEAPLLRYAASIVGKARAPDVVQDTFLKLCAEQRSNVEGHLAAWLFTVCRNRALELRRSERRLTSMEDADMEPSPDSGPANKLERKQSLTEIGAALAKLPERHREALLLKIDGGLSYKEIAKVMNLSVGNVGFILHAAIAKIREHVADKAAPAPRQVRTR